MWCERAVCARSHTVLCVNVQGVSVYLLLAFGTEGLGQAPRTAEGVRLRGTKSEGKLKILHSV